MKINNVNNLIENYLAGTAGKAEEARLKEEMKKDPGLAREIELRKRTETILARRDIIDLRNRLNMIEIRKRSASSLRRAAASTARYAAAVALLALISAAVYFVLRPSSPHELYGKYYSRYELPGAVRSVTSSGNTLMDNALAAYNAGDYQKAILFLEQITGAEEPNIESVFMHGMANMEISNYPVASRSFNKVLEHNDNLYLEDAAWYLGLCYMMTGDTEKAVKQFTSIAVSDSRYGKKAARLARRLR